jgi:hypothetical protein
MACCVDGLTMLGFVIRLVSAYKQLHSEQVSTTLLRRPMGFTFFPIKVLELTSKLD